MSRERASGVLLHPTSLPSPYGIGDVGTAAHRFVDWLAAAGQQYWQLLPLVPPDEGGSPYQSVSAFAGNPLLISPDSLSEDGLLDTEQLALAAKRCGHAVTTVDYPLAFQVKAELLRAAATRFFALPDSAALRRDYDCFRATQRGWLDDYATFLALREMNQGRAWTEWDHGVDAEQRPLAAADEQLQASKEFHRFEQWACARQWDALREHARRVGVALIGDLPIYVAEDSADVWAHRDLFELDESGRPRLVAGVPPDYFSETGQLWNNPLYDWQANRDQGYRWWTDRVRAVLGRVDVVRLDHFRGFEAYWAVDAGEPDARNGRWLPGPGAELFDSIRRNLEENSVDGREGSPSANQRDAPPPAIPVWQRLPFIAENLGHITAEVDALQQATGLPGMVVLQFALLGEIEGHFDPATIAPETVAYTGTHDNNTTRGWFEQEVLPHPEKLENLRRFTKASCPEAVAWEIIEVAWHSSAAVAVAPVQDLLGLPAGARMNRPGTSHHDAPNWAWRLEPGQLGEELAGSLRALTEAADRA